MKKNYISQNKSVRVAVEYKTINVLIRINYIENTK